MHRIDTATATADNKFTEGSPQSGVAPTVVSADILNAMQEEIAHVIESNGIALNKPDNTQLFAAIALMMGGAASTTEAGRVQLATTAEAVAGTDDSKAVTPVGLAAAVAAGIAAVIEFGTDWIRLGSFLLQWGSASIASTGAHTGSVAITFPVEFGVCLHVAPAGTKAAICSYGLPGVFTPSGITTTGCTINVNTNVDDTNSGYSMNQAATFTWFAIGTVAA